MGRLQDKVAIILGASDERGMGAATAQRFVAEGARVVMAARRIEAAQALAARIGAEAFACDITDEAQIAALAAQTTDRHGGVDIAVNFAGEVSLAPILEVDAADLRRLCELQFTGPVLFIKHMAARMARGGSIILTSSLGARLAAMQHAAYGGTKAGLDHVVRIAANELGERGVRVNTILPGPVRTAMTEAWLADDARTSPLMREVPLGRLGDVDDIANAALWLASSESGATTGQIIDCSAGQSLRRFPLFGERRQS
jgi:NAD(P)-dependent dehydrogenase (short-subunit alcohol dehydrogenase family)